MKGATGKFSGGLSAIGLVSPSVKWADSIAIPSAASLSQAFLTDCSLPKHTGSSGRVFLPFLSPLKSIPLTCSSTGGPAPWVTPTPGRELTFLQLVSNHPEEGHRDHDQVGQEAGLTQFPHGGPTQLTDHALVGDLATDGGCVAQDDQATDQEEQRDLQRGFWGLCTLEV